jgi:hypothetical protein
MKKLLLILSFFAVSFSIFAQNNVLTLKNATIVDVVHNKLDTGRVVIITGNKITAVKQKTTIPKGAMVVDATGKYLIPGLWDMHTHTLSEERIETAFPLFIANGITGIRDMGMPLENLDLLKQWRKEIEQGTRIGPRIFASGATLGGARPQLSISVTTEAEARQAVITLKQKGADFIKVHSLLPRPMFFVVADEVRKQKLTFVGHVPASVKAEEASDAGQKSMEHLYGILESCSTNEAEVRKEIEQAAKIPDRWNAWGAIVRTTDRLYGRQASEQTFSKEKSKDLFARFVKNNTWQCPTLVIRRAFAFRNDTAFTKDMRLKYLTQAEVKGWNSHNDTRNVNLTSEEIRNRKIRLEKETSLVGEMQQAGVNILAGTDLGNPYIYPGFSLHDELLLLVQAGLQPIEALQTATINSAKFFGIEKDLGTIEEGKLADIVILTANPLEDISNTTKIDAVIVNGKFLQRHHLDNLLKQVEDRQSKK